MISRQSPPTKRLYCLHALFHPCMAPLFFRSDYQSDVLPGSPNFGTNLEREIRSELSTWNAEKLSRRSFFWLNGTRGRTRTGTVFPPVDFESTASTNFATRARGHCVAKQTNTAEPKQSIQAPASCILFSGIIPISLFGL